jgi:hypothetical protein
LRDLHTGTAEQVGFVGPEVCGGLRQELLRGALAAHDAQAKAPAPPHGGEEDGGLAIDIGELSRMEPIDLGAELCDSDVDAALAGFQRCAPCAAI